MRPHLCLPGGVLAIVFVQSLPEAEQRRLGKVAALMAVAAAALSLLRLAFRASFLMGGMSAGAMEPMMRDMVMDSPLGASMTMRLISLALIHAILLRGRIWQSAAALGAAGRGFGSSMPRGFSASMLTCLRCESGRYSPIALI